MTIIDLFTQLLGWAADHPLMATGLLLVFGFIFLLALGDFGLFLFIELRITNGPVEGYNSKIRMISHRAFGFHSANALIAMIMLLCSGITLSPLGHGNALHTL